MDPEQKHKEIVKSSLNELAKSVNSKSKVVSDITHLIEATSDIPLSNLEYWESFIRQEYSAALRTTALPNWKVWSKSSSLLTWIDLFSWDGFRREKILRTLNGQVPNRFFLAIVLRRLNDWVPQVRQAAREALPIIIQTSDPTDVADAILFTLAHWSSWGRIKDLDRESLLATFAKKEVAVILKNKIVISPSGALTMMMAQLGRTAVIDPFLVEISQSAVQPAVRAKAYRCLLEGKVSWLVGKEWEWTDKYYGIGRLKPIVAKRDLTITSDFLPTLKEAAKDRSSMVRRVSAEFLIREMNNLGIEATLLAKAFASDSSRAVAERGEFALKKLAHLR